MVKGGKRGTQSRDLQFPQKLRGNSPFKTRSQQPSYSYVILNQSKWLFFKAFKPCFGWGEKGRGKRNWKLGFPSPQLQSVHSTWPPHRKGRYYDRLHCCLWGSCCYDTGWSGGSRIWRETCSWSSINICGGGNCCRVHQHLEKSQEHLTVCLCNWLWQRLWKYHTLQKFSLHTNPSCKS